MVPTGTMTFYDGATPVGTSPLIGGSATLLLANLTVGNHNLTAEYSGDPNYEPSTSPVLVQVITSGPVTPAVPGQAIPGGVIPGGV